MGNVDLRASMRFSNSYQNEFDTNRDVHGICCVTKAYNDWSFAYAEIDVYLDDGYASMGMGTTKHYICQVLWSHYQLQQQFLPSANASSLAWHL